MIWIVVQTEITGATPELLQLLNSFSHALSNL